MEEADDPRRKRRRRRRQWRGHRRSTETDVSTAPVGRRAVCSRTGLMLRCCPALGRGVVGR